VSDEIFDDSDSGKTREQLQKELEEQQARELLEKKPSITEIIDLYPEELKPHPINKTLYGDEEPDDTLIDSILKNGQLEPIIITKNNVIISGHRRWLALKRINKDPKCYMKERDDLFNTIYRDKYHIKLKAKCSIVDFHDDETTEQLAIVDYNRRRDKRASQLFNEIVLLKDIYSRDSSISSSEKQFRDEDVPKLARMLKEADQEISDQIDTSLSDREILDKYGHLLEQLGFDHQEYVIESIDKDYPRTRDEIAGILDIGHTNMDKLYEVGIHAKAGHEAGIFSMKKLDREKREDRWTINGASIIVDIDKHSKTKKRGSAIAGTIIQDVLNNDKSPSQAKKEFDKAVPKEKKVPIRAKIERPKPAQDQYSIIYFNPILFPESYFWSKDKFNDLKHYELPSGDDAALFLLTAPYHLQECMTLMELWNFEYKSYAVIKNPYKGFDDYFPYSPYLILFGTKGNWPEPNEGDENLFKGEIIQTKEELYEVIEKMYPDVKSRYEPYKETNNKTDTETKETQREGWGISLNTLKQQERQRREGEERKKRDKDGKKGPASPAAEPNW
jgi:hypothetical protein